MKKNCEDDENDDIDDDDDDEKDDDDGNDDDDAKDGNKCGSGRASLLNYNRLVNCRPAASVFRFSS